MGKNLRPFSYHWICKIKIQIRFDKSGFILWLPKFRRQKVILQDSSSNPSYNVSCVSQALYYFILNRHQLINNVNSIVV